MAYTRNEGYSTGINYDKANPAATGLETINRTNSVSKGHAGSSPDGPQKMVGVPLVSCKKQHIQVPSERQT